MYGLRVEQHDVNHCPTAETLRSAAKVLEEKAKELDKPKLTEKQKWIRDHSRDEFGWDAALIHYSEQTFPTYKYNCASSSVRNYKKLISVGVLRSKGGYEIKVVTLLDEDNEIMVAIDMDY